MYYVLFFDNSTKQITEAFYEKIIEATSTDAVGIEINGGFYKFSSIQKILPESEFFEQYPQYRKTAHQPYSDVPGNIVTRAKDSKGSLLKGFRKVKPNATLEDIKNFMTNTKKKEVKYKTYGEAKAAGVFK